MISRDDFVHLLRELAPTLEVLGLAYAMFRDGQAWQSPVKVLDDLAVEGFPANVKDLRLYRVYLTDNTPDLRFNNLHTLSTLLHLTIYMRLVHKLDLVPSSLQSVTIYHTSSSLRDYPRGRYWLSTTDILRRVIPKWKEHAFRLTVLRQRAAKMLVSDLRRWQIQCYMLGYFCGQSNVELHTEIGCVLRSTPDR